MIGDYTSENEEEGKVWIIFASLYLVLLAFFIALASISSFNPEKSKDATESLQNQFTGTGGIARMELPAAEKPKSQEIGIVYIINRTINDTLKLGKNNVEVRGNVIRISVDQSIFFSSVEPTVVADDTLIRNIISELNKRPFPYSVEFMLNSAVESSDNTSTLKAGALARSFTDNGLEPEYLSAGIKKGTKETVDIYFITSELGNE